MGGNDTRNEKTCWIWDDLPDPRDPRTPAGARTSVVLRRRAWRHIFEKHILPREEPWADIFSREVLRQLFQTKCDPTSSEPVLTEAVRRLGDQIRASLERPLVLIFEARGIGEEEKRPLRSWILVLPSGATAYVHEKKERKRLATCFFPSYALVLDNKTARWHRVVQCLVGRYGVFDLEHHAVRLPDANTVKTIRKGKSYQELHSGIRFVTPENWGFCTNVEGAPYRGRLGEWPAADTPGPRRQHRLKPRRPKRRYEDEDENL